MTDNFNPLLNIRAKEKDLRAPHLDLIVLAAQATATHIAKPTIKQPEGSSAWTSLNTTLASMPNIDATDRVTPIVNQYAWGYLCIGQKGASIAARLSDPRALFVTHR
jgi:hypothetical protein